FFGGELEEAVQATAIRNAHFEDFTQMAQRLAHSIRMTSSIGFMSGVRPAQPAADIDSFRATRQRIPKRQNLDAFLQDSPLGRVDEAWTGSLSDLSHKEIAVRDEIFGGGDFTPPDINLLGCVGLASIEGMIVENRMPRIIAAPSVGEILTGKDDRVSANLTGQIQRGCR